MLGSYKNTANTAFNKLSRPSTKTAYGLDPYVPEEIAHFPNDGKGKRPCMIHEKWTKALQFKKNYSAMQLIFAEIQGSLWILGLWDLGALY